MAVISASGRTNTLQQQPSVPNTQRNCALHINSMLLLTTPLARFALGRPFPWACYGGAQNAFRPPNELLRSAGPCVGFALAGRVEHAPQCAAAWLTRGPGGGGGGWARRQAPTDLTLPVAQQRMYSRGYFCLPAYGVVLGAAVPCLTALPHRQFGSNIILPKKIRPEDSSRRVRPKGFNLLHLTRANEGARPTAREDALRWVHSNTMGDGSCAPLAATRSRVMSCALQHTPSGKRHASCGGGARATDRQEADRRPGRKCKSALYTEEMRYLDRFVQ
jgi:hypothetical protein